MSDITERLRVLVRNGRDEGMKMDLVEDAAREIERLRRERDAAREYCDSQVDEWMRLYREASAECDRLRMSATAAEAQVVALREALTNCRRLSGLDDDLVAGTSAVVMQRMAEIHQHSDAALAQPKEGQAE